MTQLAFNLTIGKARRDIGMALAEAASPDDSIRARQAIERVARRQQYLFTDDVQRELGSRLFRPNVMGGAWRWAIERKLIVATDKRKRSADPLKHAHTYPLYASLIHRGRAG